MTEAREEYLSDLTEIVWEDGEPSKTDWCSDCDMPSDLCECEEDYDDT